MATTLVVPWAELLPSSEPTNPLVPSIELLLIGREGRTWKANFLVDSGADISLAHARCANGWDWFGTPASQCS